MEVKEKVKSHPDVVDYFKELLFHNNHIEKPKIKRLKSIDLLSVLPFYDELNVIKNKSCIMHSEDMQRVTKSN